MSNATKTHLADGLPKKKGTVGDVKNKVDCLLLRAFEKRDARLPAGDQQMAEDTLNDVFKDACHTPAEDLDEDFDGLGRELLEAARLGVDEDFGVLQYMDDQDIDEASGGGDIDADEDDDDLKIGNNNVATEMNREAELLLFAKMKKPQSSNREVISNAKLSRFSQLTKEQLRYFIQARDGVALTDKTNLPKTKGNTATVKTDGDCLLKRAFKCRVLPLLSLES
jgi:hypothetical protein